MKPKTRPSLKVESRPLFIDARIKKRGDWQGKTLSQLRALIRQADPAAVEEVKWRKPTHPTGVPVWYHDGIICTGGTLKNAVRLNTSKARV
jgi:hypothetical protein